MKNINNHTDFIINKVDYHYVIIINYNYILYIGINIIINL